MIQAPHVPGQVLIKLDPESEHYRQAKKSVIDCLPKKADLARDFNAAGFAIVTLPLEFDLEEVIRRIEKCDGVEFAEPNYIDEGTTSP